MKKLLYILLLVVIISIIAQKFGLLNYFPNNTQPPKERLPADIPSVSISPGVNRPIMGIHYRMIDRQTALQNNLVEGAYITEIVKGSPAEKAGLQDEDIIIEIDRRIIGGLSEQSLYTLISTLKPGNEVSLKIWRNNMIKNVLVTLD